MLRSSFVLLAATVCASPASLSPTTLVPRGSSEPLVAKPTPGPMDLGGEDHSEVRAAAQAYLDKPSKEHFNDFAGLLRSTPALAPRMLMSRGCSGSTQLTGKLDDILRAHGLQTNCTFNNSWTGHWTNEIYLCNLNPYCKNNDISTAMKQVVAESVVGNKALVMKIGSEHSLLTTMKEMGGLAFASWRSNGLSKLLCDTRDCFPDPKLKKNGLEGALENVGPHKNACFGRRQLDRGEQTLVTAENLDKLKGSLKQMNMVGGILEEDFKTVGYKEGEYAVVAAESLFATEADDTDEAFSESVEAWSTAVKALGVTPDQQIIKDYLTPLRGGHPGTPCSTLLTNGDEVEAMCKEMGEPYASWPSNP